MLHLIPPRWHIAALRTAHALRLRWWRWRGHAGSGCRVLAINPQDRVLLIRHSYGLNHWMLPGGGMKRGEDVLIAAARETFEETAVRLCDAVEIGRVTDMLHGSNHDVRVVAGWTADSPQADGREIIEAAFFALDALPHGIARNLPELLRAYVTAAKAARRGG